MHLRRHQSSCEAMSTLRRVAPMSLHVRATRREANVERAGARAQGCRSSSAANPEAAARCQPGNHGFRFRAGCLTRNPS